MLRLHKGRVQRSWAYACAEVLAKTLMQRGQSSAEAERKNLEDISRYLPGMKLSFLEGKRWHLNISRSEDYG